MKFFVNIFLFFLIVFPKSGLWSLTEQKAVQYDSSIVKTQQPSKLQEEEVFSKIDLDFAKKVEDTDVGLWDRFWDWLLNLIFGKADHDDKITMQKIVIWVLVIAGVALIIWLLTRTEFTSFLKGNSKNAEFNFSDIEDITNVNFDTKIAEACEEGDYRVAIRWLYLKQLFSLNEKGAIAYQPYKTNIDYSLELIKTPYQKQFMDLSKIYDYVWYGKYSISQPDYQLFEKQFKEFETTLNV